MRKNWIALFAILLVALAPVSFADDNGDDETHDVDASVEADATVDSDGGRLGKERMQEVREGMRERVEQVREMRTEARQQFASRREALRALRGQLDQCRGRQTDECKQLRRDARLEARDTLRDAVSNMVTMLKQARDRIAASDLAAEQKTQLLSELDAKIAEATEAAQTSDEVTEESSAADVKEKAQEVRKAAQEARHSLRSAANQLVAQKLGHALRRADALEHRLEKALENMQRKGVDVSGLNTEALESKIGEAKIAYQEALDLFKQAREADPGQKDELMKQATTKLRESHQALKEAHALLRDIVRGIKGKQGGSEALDQPAETEEQPATDEDAQEAETEEAEEDEEEAEEVSDKSEDETEDESDEEDSEKDESAEQ